MSLDIFPTDVAIWEQVIDPHPLTIAPDTLLIDAIAQLTQQDSTDLAVYAFVVVDTRPIGILTSHRILHQVAMGTDLHQATAIDAMSHPPLTLKRNDLRLYHLATYLHSHTTRCIAVVDEQGQLVGAIDNHRLQLHFCRHLMQLQQQIGQLRPEKSDLEQHHAFHGVQAFQSPSLTQSHASNSRTLLEASPDLIIRMTREGNYLDFLPARDFKTIMPSPDMIGKNVYDVLPPSLAQERMQYVEQALQTGETQVYEYSLTIDGILSHQEARITPSGANEVIVIVREISDRKQRETQFEQVKAELSQAKTDLEVRIQERTVALEATNQQLQHEIVQRQRVEQTLYENQIYLHIIRNISACLTSDLSIEQIIQITVEQLKKYFKTLRVAYFVLDEDNTISVVHHVELPEIPPIVVNTNISTATEWVKTLRQFQPIIAGDVNQSSLLAPQKEALLAEGVRALLDIPLKHSDSEIGILSFESPEPRCWSEHEIVTLIEVANYLSLILQEANTQKLREWIEAALLQSQRTNALLATALEKAGDAIEITNAELKIEYVNSAWEAMTGYSRTEAIGQTPATLLRSDTVDQSVYQQIEEAIAAGHVWRGRLLARRQDKTLFHQEVTISPVLNATGMIERYVAVKRDITERQRVEEQLKASLREKELLLKEVHHRVKNNMQVISSIFSLQSQLITDPDTLSILTDSQNRIRSMALIHEKLYQSTSLAQIDFADYVRNLVQNLISTYRDGVNKIQLNLNISNVSLDIDTAIPCGLIINELVSNSLKHAFKHQQFGEIMIVSNRTTHRQLHLIIRDNGVGLPQELNIQKTNSLGLRLIRALSRQLNGKWEIYNNQGTIFEIIFPASPEHRIS